MSDTPPEETNDQSDVSSRTAARRAAREATRSTIRSPRLRRRGTEEEEIAEESPAQSKKPAAAQKKRVVKPAAKKKAVAKKKVAAKKKTAVKKRAPVEEFELRALPDGTNVRVKIENDTKGKPRRVPTRRSGGGVNDGPGPAIIYPADLPRPERQTATRSFHPTLFSKETQKSVTWLKKKISVKPTIALILGSGLAAASPLDTDEKPISFSDVPHFLAPSVPGHGGSILHGEVDGHPLLVSSGRLHYYETGSMADTVYPIKTFLALGVRHFIFTTAAGALNPNYREGDLMLVEDHLNMMGSNPLLGTDPSSEPSPFVNTHNLYDVSLADTIEKRARRARLRFQRGVLAAVAGPFYETGAERKALRTLGADAVCMSTVPEALMAAYAGASVTALALIANDSSSASTAALAHNDVTAAGKRHSKGLRGIISSLIAGR